MAENLEVVLLSELKNTLKSQYAGVKDPYRENADGIIELCDIRLEDIARREKKRYPSGDEYLRMKWGMRLASDTLEVLQEDYPEQLAGYAVRDLPTNKPQWLYRVIHESLMALAWGVAGYEADLEEEVPGSIERFDKERADYAERRRKERPN